VYDLNRRNKVRSIEQDSRFHSNALSNFRQLLQGLRPKAIQEIECNLRVKNSFSHALEQEQLSSLALQLLDSSTAGF